MAYFSLLIACFNILEEFIKKVETTAKIKIGRKTDGQTEIKVWEFSRFFSACKANPNKAMEWGKKGREREWERDRERVEWSKFIYSFKQNHTCAHPKT